MIYSLISRIHDVSRSGFNDWPFMSVHSWGESPFGTWKLEIHNDGRLLGKWLLIIKTSFTISFLAPTQTKKILKTSSE